MGQHTTDILDESLFLSLARKRDGRVASPPPDGGPLFLCSAACLLDGAKGPLFPFRSLSVSFSNLNGESEVDSLHGVLR